MKKIYDKKVFLNESVECINKMLIDLESKPILRLKDLDTNKTALVFEYDIYLYKNKSIRIKVPLVSYEKWVYFFA